MQHSPMHLLWRRQAGCAGQQFGTKPPGRSGVHHDEDVLTACLKFASWCGVVWCAVLCYAVGDV